MRGEGEGEELAPGSNACAYCWEARGQQLGPCVSASFLPGILRMEVYSQLLGYSLEWRLACLVYLNGEFYPILLPYDVLKAHSCKFTDVFPSTDFSPMVKGSGRHALLLQGVPEGWVGFCDDSQPGE